MVTLAALLIIFLGFLGLAVDLGRLYITRNELQGYADAAALAAAMQLNGKQSGVTRAVSAVDAGANRYEFGTRTVSSTQRTVAFSTSTAAGWSQSPASNQLAGLQYARVSVSADLPLYFMPFVKGPSQRTLSVQAVAGRVPASTMAAGNLLPASPIAPNASDPVHFGFVPGARYALRWSSNLGGNSGTGNGNNFNIAPPSGSTCEGDLALGWGAGSTIDRARESGSFRGWWGSSSGNSLDEWIGHGYPYAKSAGETIEMHTGTKNGRKNAMESRVNSDTDHVSTTYAAYESNLSGSYRLGNGRRLVAVPINAGPLNYVAGGSPGGGNGGNNNGDGNGNGGGSGNGNANGNGNGNSGSSGSESSGGTQNRVILGFAAFYLDRLDYSDTSGNEPYCGEYVGTFVQGANSHAGGPATVAKIRLVQ